ncbi:MAG: TetR family transcriptional regulator C-terminal domain-containing protein [Phycisphaeraceae bacterium]|nr:TetR family transcriptional regulator C-terminal domain-containing protein [Phycisphaeraceae bacterium]
MYHFFPSKEALLVGVLEWYRDNLWTEVLTPAEQRAGDPIERVFALMGLYRLGMEMTGCTMGCPIGNLALELSDDHPAVRGMIDLNFRNWIAGVRGWLEAAEDRLPPGTDLDALAGFVLTVMEGGIMRSRAAGSLEPFDESITQLRAYFDLLLGGVAHTHTQEGGPS